MFYWPCFTGLMCLRTEKKEKKMLRSHFQFSTQVPFNFKWSFFINIVSYKKVRLVLRQFRGWLRWRWQSLKSKRWLRRGINRASTQSGSSRHRSQQPATTTFHFYWHPIERHIQCVIIQLRKISCDTDFDLFDFLFLDLTQEDLSFLDIDPEIYGNLNSTDDVTSVRSRRDEESDQEVLAKSVNMCSVLLTSEITTGDHNH